MMEPGFGDWQKIEFIKENISRKNYEEKVSKIGGGECVCVVGGHFREIKKNFPEYSFAQYTQNHEKKNRNSMILYLFNLSGMNVTSKKNKSINS